MLSTSFYRLCSATAGAMLLLVTGLGSSGLANSENDSPLVLSQESLPSSSLPPPSQAPLPPASEYLPPLPIAEATHLVLRLGEKRVYVYDDDQVLADFPVAVGTSRTPTPTGEFEVFQMIVNPVWENPWTGEVNEPGADSALGVRWIGFARRDNGIIGFHGTPTVSSIGQAASNGCVRLRNEDVVKLFDHVHMGMKVVVEQ